MKLIYVVIDGLGDLPLKVLDNQTPLEYAETPNLDFLASIGKVGLMYSVRKGVAPESDVAVISILGYDPYRYHVGRGPLEAVGAGLKMMDGDLALRCNFATLGNDRRIIDRRVGRNLTTEEASHLSEAVNKNVSLTSHSAEFEFKNTLGHRGVLVIRSKTMPLSGNITNTDPAYLKVGGIGIAKKDVEPFLEDCRPLDESESSKVSAQLVNEFTWKSHEVLENHPVNMRRSSNGMLKANVILSRDAGAELPKFFDINAHYKVRFACLADMPVERGIAKLAGMHLIEIPPPSGNIKDDCILRAGKLLSAISNYDCFYIHLKGPDEPGHDGDYKRKIQVIADIDRYFFGRVLENVRLQETLFCVTADHSTPCEQMSHTDDPVPVLIAGGKIHPDSAKKFSEKECKNGSLGIIESGNLLMPLLMKLLKE
ncbi:MAG: alkaline phosphatase family protein [Nitrososphaerota archaeon]|nr:alkaline phosphatase family protein [Nitrososphaerota archaeon]